MKNNNLKKNKWYLLNAKDKILGRFSTKIVYLLMCKNYFYCLQNYFLDNYVVVINANKIVVTGNKFNNKLYYSHSGYIGNLKKLCFKDLFKRSPSKIIYYSVKGMLPKNHLGKKMLSRLKIYNNDVHNNNAQKLIFINDI